MIQIFAEFESRPSFRREQELLLHALLAPEAEARDALARWVAETDFDSLDPASFRLMPALFARWGNDPASEPHQGRLKGIYRYSLFRANVVAAAGRRVLEAFRKAGIEAVAIKGIALGVRYYRNLALRPMSDVDVLVRRADVAAAEAVLGDCGWSYRYDAARKPHDVHSYDYVDGRGSGFDLHWFSLLESVGDGSDDGVWARAETMDWHGMPLLVPAREDLALIAMVNGMREGEGMRGMWVHDLAVLITDAPDFDWELLWAEAGRRNVREQVFNALLLLARAVPWLVPEARLHACLLAAPAFTLERLRAIVAETRTDTLTAEGRSYAAKRLRSGLQGYWSGLLSGWKTFDQYVADPAVPKHLRVTYNDAGEIVGLYVHRPHVPLLGQLFTVVDPVALGVALARLGREGEVALPPGCLLPRETPHIAYEAKVTLDMPPLFTLHTNEVGDCPLFVENTSPEPWTVTAEGGEQLYGISYHLHDAEDKLISWDNPRTHLMTPRPGRLAFVAPGQRLACRMKVHAPELPGRYRLHVDVLRERVTWFSANVGRLPIVELDVIA
jgi:hypothetical protein